MGARRNEVGSSHVSIWNGWLCAEGIGSPEAKCQQALGGPFVFSFTVCPLYTRRCAEFNGQKREQGLIPFRKEVYNESDRREMVVRIGEKGSSEGNRDREPSGGYSTHTGVGGQSGKAHRK